MSSTNLLQAVNERMNIDIDSLDTEFLKTLSITPNDQTCNPRWLALQMEDPASASLLVSCATELREQGFLAVCTRLAVSFCHRNIDLIKGRVFVQTSPSAAYNYQQTLDHARLYASEFAKAGIPPTRYCIKIMATGPGLRAAKVLRDEGIATLGTGVFSVAQAVACSQAGCLFISPYYNEIRTFIDPSLWPNVNDPAKDHPFSNRIAQMVKAYQDLYQQTGMSQPLIKNAGFHSYREVLASAELGCHSATLSKDTLQQMQDMAVEARVIEAPQKVASLKDPYFASNAILSSRLKPLLDHDPLAKLEPGEKWISTSLSIDYLENNGKPLQDALDKDEAATRMVKDALELFVYCENGMKQAVEGIWAKASL